MYSNIKVQMYIKKSSFSYDGKWSSSSFIINDWCHICILFHIRIYPTNGLKTALVSNEQPTLVRKLCVIKVFNGVF